MAYIFPVRNLSGVEHIRDHMMLIHVGKLVGASDTYNIFTIPQKSNPAVLLMAVSAS